MLNMHVQWATDLTNRDDEIQKTLQLMTEMQTQIESAHKDLDAKNSAITRLENEISTLKLKKNVEISLPQQTNKKIHVVCDSTLRYCDEYFREVGLNSTVHSFPGRGASFVCERAKELIENCTTPPEILVIHCGTNSTTGTAEEPLKDIKAAFNALVRHLSWTHANLKVILSGITHRLDDPSLNSRIDTINIHLKSLESKNILYLDHNSTFKNLHKILNGGGLHLRPSGYRQVGTNIKLLLTGVVNQNTVRQYPLQSHLPRSTRPQRPLSQSSTPTSYIPTQATARPQTAPPTSHYPAHTGPPAQYTRQNPSHASSSHQQQQGHQSHLPSHMHQIIPPQSQPQTNFENQAAHGFQQSHTPPHFQQAVAAHARQHTQTPPEAGCPIQYAGSQSQAHPETNYVGSQAQPEPNYPIQYYASASLPPYPSHPNITSQPIACNPAAALSASKPAMVYSPLLNSSAQQYPNWPTQTANTWYVSPWGHL